MSGDLQVLMRLSVLCFTETCIIIDLQMVLVFRAL